MVVTENSNQPEVEVLTLEQVAAQGGLRKGQVLNLSDSILQVWDEVAKRDDTNGCPTQWRLNQIRKRTQNLG